MKKRYFRLEMSNGNDVYQMQLIYGTFQQAIEHSFEMLKQKIGRSNEWEQTEFDEDSLISEFSGRSMEGRRYYAYIIAMDVIKL